MLLRFLSRYGVSLYAVSLSALVGAYLVADYQAQQALDAEHFAQLSTIAN